MPYNNTAIPPLSEISGQAVLPLARVKKIFHVDEDIGPVSNQAAFLITKAAEMFVQYFAEQALIQAKAEGKPRRNIQYKDCSNAVAKVDNLEFLTDIVPRTTTWAEYKKQKARQPREPGAASEGKNKPLPAGQTTLDGTRPRTSHVGIEIDNPEIDPGSQAGPSTQEGANEVRDTPVNGTGLVFEHYVPNGDAQDQDRDGDVEMQ